MYVTGKRKCRIILTVIFFYKFNKDQLRTYGIILCLPKYYIIKIFSSNKLSVFYEFLFLTQKFKNKIGDRVSLQLCLAWSLSQNWLVLALTEICLPSARIKGVRYQAWQKPKTLFTSNMERTIFKVLYTSNSITFSLTTPNEKAHWGTEQTF